MCILIVEDDNELRETFERMLCDMGYAVASASNGRSALERIREKTPTLAFIDLLMPVMTGFDLIEQMKADGEMSKIPIVAMTAAWKARVEGVLTMKKPFCAEAALELVEAYCGAPDIDPTNLLPTGTSG
ncbi:MAG TPA: response regulator [Polyangiaceae bacterium]|nr:response regulator [Polyangiaceae bacterium]